MQRIGYIFLVSVLLFSCKDKAEKTAKGTHPIILGDPKLMVMETDSQYLRNNVADITITASNKTNAITAEKKIEQVVEKVDSQAAVKEAIAAPSTLETILASGNGYAISSNVEATKAGTVFQVKKDAFASETKLQLQNILEPKVMQFAFMQAYFKLGTDTFILEEIPEYKSVKELAVKDGLVSVVNPNNFAGKVFDGRVLHLASDRALRKAGKKRPELVQAENIFKIAKDDASANVFWKPNATHIKINGKVGAKAIIQILKFEMGK